MKSRSRSLILEEFLTAAGYKELTFLEVSGEKIVMEESDTQTTLSIALTSAGYVEGRIYSEKGQVQPSVSRFSSDDFTEGTFSFTIEKKQNLRNGSDVIRIDTVRQDIKIPVEWWTESSALIKDKEQKLLLKKKRAELMHNYLYFRIRKYWI